MPTCHGRSRRRWILALLTLMLSLLLASTARGSNGGSAQAIPCDAVALSGLEDEWALLEYPVGPAGVRYNELRLEGSSTWDYGSRLHDCALSGKTQLPRNGTGLHTLFRYRPAHHLAETSGRRLEFRLSPGLANAGYQLEGNLALRLEIDSQGAIRLPELLYASSSDLGALVLDHLQDSLEVVSPGQQADSRIDILYLRFHRGDLVTFSQLHYAPRH